MGFVHTLAHFFVFFRIFSLFFQTYFCENVYVVMGSVKKSGQTKPIPIEFDLP